MARRARNRFSGKPGGWWIAASSQAVGRVVVRELAAALAGLMGVEVAEMRLWRICLTLQVVGSDPLKPPTANMEYGL